MSRRLLFAEGASAYGSFSETISWATGQSISFTIRGIENSDDPHLLVGSSSGNDAIYTKSTDGYEFQVIFGGTKYDTNISSEDIYDGADHTLEVSRSGSSFIFKVDGETKATISVSSSAFSIDYLAYDNGGDVVFPCELSDMVIAGHTYPITEATTTSIEDTTGDADLTLYSTQTVLVSEWEWIGSLMEIDRTYSSPNGLVTEKRVEGTRRRVIEGYPMDEPMNKQVGTEALSVSAFNGGVESSLEPVSGVSSIDCDDESFNPLTGTNMIIQSQKWVSWSNS